MVCHPEPVRDNVRRVLQCVIVSETRMGQAVYTEFMTLPFIRIHRLQANQRRRPLITATPVPVIESRKNGDRDPSQRQCDDDTAQVAARQTG